MANVPLTTGHRPSSQRVGQSCDACAQVDDHPRVHVGQDDGSVKSYHFDCAAEMGNEHARAVLEEAGRSNSHGAKLVAHLLAKHNLKD